MIPTPRRREHGIATSADGTRIAWNRHGEADHASGHGCLTGAVLNTMADFFGTDKVEITVISGRSLNGVPIPPREFDRFSRATKEVIDARVWGGIHFRTTDVQGTVIGKKVAHWLRKHYFQPVR